MPVFLEAREGDLQRRHRRHDLDRHVAELAGEPRRDAVAERVAGRQNDDLAGQPHTLHPARHVAERAVRCPSRGAHRQLAGNEFKRSPSADHQTRRQARARAAADRPSCAVV